MGEWGDKTTLCGIRNAPQPQDEWRMNLPLRQTLSRHRFTFQRELFSWLEETVGALGECYRQLVRVLEPVQPKELSRLEKQASMTLEQML